MSWAAVEAFVSMSLTCIHRLETDPVIVEEQRFRQCRFVPVMMAQDRFGVQERRWRGRSCSR